MDDPVEIESGEEYGYEYDVWIIGYCGIYNGTDANITLYIGSLPIPLYDYHSTVPITSYVPVCIPISAKQDRLFRVLTGADDDSDMHLKIYRCF